MSQSYYEHERGGYLDFRRNTSVYYDARGTYSTDIITNEAVNIVRTHDREAGPLFLYLPYQAVHAPLEAPRDEFDGIKKTNNSVRDIYRAMLSRMDKGVKKVVKELKSQELWNNTILVFSTDNGGAVSQAGSNHPLRGTKGTLFEGGTHGVGFVAGGAIGRSKTLEVSQNFFWRMLVKFLYKTI